MGNLTGKQVSRYKILNSIGQGGMASVYLARDTRLEREVAVKVIRKDMIQPALLEKMLIRFEREAKALAQMDHDNIVKIIDYGDYEGIPYLVMPYLQGGTLKQYMGQKWDGKVASRFLFPIAQALAYAHKKKIIHRDVKPANILITENAQPMLSDFGIAKIVDTNDSHTLTGTNVGVGTPEYMSPEQGLGKIIDHRTDIYSLGVVLFEMVTGRKPFLADTPLAVALKQINDPLPNPREQVADLDQQVEEIIYKALAKNVDDRYKTMHEMAKALEKAGGGSWQNDHLALLPKKVVDFSNGDTFDQLQDIGNRFSAKKKKHWPIRWMVLGVGLAALAIAGGFWFKNKTVNPLEFNATLASIQEVVVIHTTTPEPTSTIIIQPTQSEIPPTPTQALSFPYLVGTPLPALDKITSENVTRISELARLGMGELNSIAVSQDEKQIVVAFSTGVNLYDRETLRIILTIPISNVDEVAFSSDSKSIYMEKAGEFIVWDLDKKENVMSLSGVDMLPQRDGSVVIVQLSDNTYRIINPLNQEELLTLKRNGSDNYAYSAIRFDGKKFTSTSDGKALDVFDIETGKYGSKLGGYAGFSTVDLLQKS
jgi:serine/threonine protein kinase